MSHRASLNLSLCYPYRIRQHFGFTKMQHIENPAGSNVLRQFVEIVNTVQCRVRKSNCRLKRYNRCSVYSGNFGLRCRMQRPWHLADSLELRDDFAFYERCYPVFSTKSSKRALVTGQGRILTQWQNVDGLHFYLSHFHIDLKAFRRLVATFL